MRSHPSFRIADEGEIQSAVEAERLRAAEEMERQRTLVEAARKRTEAEAAERQRLRAELAERQRAEASRQHAASASAEHGKAEEQSVSEPESVWYKEAFMGKRIIYAVLAVVVVVGFIYWMKQHRAATDIANGEIFSNDLTPGSRTHSGDVTPAIAKPAPVQTVTNADGSTVVMPSTDSQSPNAPEGMHFSGTGKYQVYRQGNLTWRVNTESGESCILFATEEEWRKPLVFNHGCSAS